MRDDGWQGTTLAQLRALLEPDPDVAALVLFGSIAGPREYVDRFSDIDVLLVVRDGVAERFFPSIDWLAPLGRIYTHEQSLRERHRVSRVCFDDLRRIDVVVADEGWCNDIERWPEHPLHGERRAIFSRSPAVDTILRDVRTPIDVRPLSNETLDEMANHFAFAAQLAVHKIVRGDLLIALHLSLLLIADCAVLPLHSRDIDAGTRYHRSGESGDADQLAALETTRRPHTAAGLLESIEQSTLKFERQVSDLTGEQLVGGSSLLALITDARAALQRMSS